MENYISKLLILNRLWFKVPIFFSFFYSSSPRLGRQNVSSLQTYKIIFEFGPPQLNLFRYITKKAGILCKEPKEKCSFKDGEASTDGLLLICENDEMNVNECLKDVGFDVYQFERLLEGGIPMIPLFYFKYMNFIKKKIQTGFEQLKLCTNMISITRLNNDANLN